MGLWSTEYHHYQENRDRLNHLYVAMGYGGYIHNYKNVVLRKDATLLKPIEEQSKFILKTLQELKGLNSTNKDMLTRLHIIENTFKTYHEKHPILAQAIQENWSPEQTDRLVKVNDTAALRALNDLNGWVQSEFDHNLEKINHQLNLLHQVQIASIVFLIFLIAMTLLLLLRKGDLIKSSVLLKDELSSAGKIYENTLDSLIDACIIIDEKGIIENVNKKTIEVFEYSAEELLGQNITLLIPEGEHKQKHQNYMRSSSKRKKVLAKGRELFAQKKSGEQLPVEITVTPLHYRNELKFVGIIHDISHRIKLMRQLSEAIDKLSTEASTDALTGLQNRRSCQKNSKHLWSLAQRHKKPIAVLMIDIDHFKKINDTYGHDAGDTVLEQVSHVLNSHSRDEDIVCRYGGEEFLIVTFNHSKQDLIDFAERLLKEIRFLKIEYQNQWIETSISIGVTLARHNHFEHFEALLNDADQRLYQAKKEGRDCIRLNDYTHTDD